MIKKTFLIIAIVFSVLFSINASKKKVLIAYIPITHALPLYVEKDLANGSFDKFNLELIKFGSWPELMDALNTGKVDGASILLPLGIKAKEQGIDLKAIALGHRDGNVAIVSNDIVDLLALKGKTFAIPHRLSAHNVLLLKMLEKGNMKYTDVNIVELPPPEMPAALAEKRISGYLVAEPFGAKAVALGIGKVLFESKDIWQDSVCCGLVLRNDFIKKNKEIADEFITEYLNAGTYIDKNLEKSKTIIKNYIKVDDKVIDLSLKWISFRDLKIYQKDYDELVKYLAGFGLIKNPPKYDDFVDNSFVDKIIKK
ncbi:MAG: metal ABC transporter substrate-binding protein [Spirochaetes bacterium GWD1_27_9]|nr:MAG: metal ABC transporter substrate-binding protein [Spirochaetes bacterium GWC1_27_15]OHD40454.1 MAG: metal ABC transporter substrate-binding protein [Spirochaetes bacterium GWD1_27_9]